MLNNDYWKLSKFIIPLAFTSVAQDIGEQVCKSFSSLHQNVSINMVYKVYHY